MSEDHPYIAALRKDAAAKEREEDEFRRAANARIAELAEIRAFAHRRMNVMASLFDMMRFADNEEQAIARAADALKDRLCWRGDSKARAEVLAEYEKLAVAVFTACRAERNQSAKVKKALAAFESWYEASRGKPFWVLFEHYMPETQLVDF